MGHQVLAQQGSLTWDQFKWLWIGGMSAFGVVFIIGGLIFSRNKKAGRAQVRKTLVGLIHSSALREDEVVRALNAPHLLPATPELSGDEWLNRILEGSPDIEQLIRLWRRPWWVDAPIDAGIGLFLACGVCAILFLVFPATPQTSAPDGVLLAMILSMPLMGMLAGSGVGLFIGIFRIAASSEQRPSALERPPRQMEKYYSPWLLLGGSTLFLIPFILTLTALFVSAQHLLEVLVVGLGVLPLLTLGFVLLYQGPRKTPCFSTGDISGLAAVDRNACSMI